MYKANFISLFLSRVYIKQKPIFFAICTYVVPEKQKTPATARVLSRFLVAGTGIKLPFVRENKGILEPLEVKYTKGFRLFSNFIPFPYFPLFRYFFKSFVPMLYLKRILCNIFASKGKQRKKHDKEKDFCTWFCNYIHTR